MKKRFCMLLMVVISIIFISCSRTTKPNEYWEPTLEAIQSAARFNELPEILQDYSLDNTGEFPEISVVADSDNISDSQQINVKYNGVTIYEAENAQYGHRIQYGYFGENNTILIISTYRDYYTSSSIPAENWKMFINGSDVDSILYGHVSHLTVPPTNYTWQTHTGWYYDGENPPENHIKELRVPEIRYSKNTQSLILRFYVRNSYHLTQWWGNYWTEYFPTSNQLLQYGVNEWRWWDE